MAFLVHESSTFWIWELLRQLRAHSAIRGRRLPGVSKSIEWVCWCVLYWNALGVKLLRSQTGRHIWRVIMSKRVQRLKVAFSQLFSQPMRCKQNWHPASLKVHLESIDWAGFALITVHRICQNMVYMFIISWKSNLICPPRRRLLQHRRGPSEPPRCRCLQKFHNHEKLSHFQSAHI